MGDPGTWDHGIIRSDFPGGWSGDEVNAFTGEGLTELQKEAQNFVKLLLNWRKQKAVIHKGKTKQFAPLYGEKVYSMARYCKEDLVLLIMNNSDEAVEVNTDRYIELTEGLSSMKDVMTGENVDITTETITIPAKGFLLLEK